MLPDCIPLSPKLRSWTSGQFGGGLIRGWRGWRRLWLTRPTCCPTLSLPHPHPYPHRFICVAVCSVHPTLWQEELEALWYNSLGTIWLKNPSTILIQAPGLAADLVASLEILAIQAINLPSHAWRDIGNQSWNSSGSSLRILDCRWIRCWGNQSVRSRSKSWMWRWEVGEDFPFQKAGIGGERKWGRENPKEKSGKGAERVEGIQRSPVCLEQNGQRWGCASRKEPESCSVQHPWTLYQSVTAGMQPGPNQAPT